MKSEQDSSVPMAVDSLSELRKSVLDRIYLVFLIVGGIAFAAGSIDPIRDGNWLLFAGYLIIYLLIIIAYLGKNLSVKLRSSVLLFCITLFGISELWYFGFGSLGYLFLYASITIACWLVSIRWGVTLIAISSIISIVIAAVYSYGNLDMSSPQRQIADSMTDWLSPFLGFFVISIASVSFIGILLQGMQKNILANVNYQIQLEISLKEKALLLQEVHHRVRNNLQIISSLINISGSYSENVEEFKQAVELRIHAMSLMHERLSE